MVTVEEEAMEYSKAEKVVARLKDQVDGEPLTADESSGCRDQQELISRPGGLQLEKILLGSCRKTV